jgi:Flp pilus assembly protein TadD
LYRQNRYTEAIEVLGAATKSAPNVAVIHFHLGMTLAASGDHTAARKSLNQAISMDKDADWVAEARTKLGN